MDVMTRQKEETRNAVPAWLQAYVDLEWASSSEELQQKFVGQFVAVHDKTVVGHSSDRREALRQAMETGYRRRELVVVPILAQGFETSPDEI